MNLVMESKTPRVCIAGMGAVGSTLAAKLASEKIELSVVARGQTLKALQTRGLVCREGGELTCIPLNADVRAPEAIQDIIFLAGKSYQLSGLMDVVSHAVGSKTFIVPVINGLPWWMVEKMVISQPNKNNILRILDPDKKLSGCCIEQIIGCVAYVFSSMENPGQVKIDGNPKFMVSNAESGARVCPVLDIINIESKIFMKSKAIETEIWNKIILNSSTNLLSVLCGKSLGEMASDADLRRVMTLCLEELISLGEQCGFSNIYSLDQCIFFINKGSGHHTSMLQDYAKGRPLELASIGDAVVELSKSHGASVSAVETLLSLVKYKVSTYL